jgi:hypothetical protein
MQAQHILASLLLHLVLFTVAADTSARVYEEVELQRKLSADPEENVVVADGRSKPFEIVQDGVVDLLGQWQPCLAAALAEDPQAPA